MRSRITLTALLTIAFSLRLLQVRAAACAEICYTTELTGFGPGGTAGCTCSGTRQGARVGTDSCSCGQCYQATGAGIVGYAISSDNTCSFGTNCGDCDYTPDDTSTTTPSTLTPSSMPPPPTSFRPSTNTTDAPTTAPPTAMPTLSSTATSGTSSLTSDLSDSSTASPTNTNSPDVNNSNNSDPATKRGKSF
ncbi:hypothetical protein CCR75_002447 [Bremia lactucae]|uniref:Secreted protein n=1 Tax=Bremia lactucae TaxID=4779 RepID=A0A976ID12_BRELC|nr:hypothetical protein CCR75_002447 [Bremia lactucae]